MSRNEIKIRAGSFSALLGDGVCLGARMYGCSDWKLTHWRESGPGRWQEERGVGGRVQGLNSVTSWDFAVRKKKTKEIWDTRTFLPECHVLVGMNSDGAVWDMAMKDDTLGMTS